MGNRKQQRKREKDKDDYDGKVEPSPSSGIQQGSVRNSSEENKNLPSHHHRDYYFHSFEDFKDEEKSVELLPEKREKIVDDEIYSTFKTKENGLKAVAEVS